MQPDQPTDPKPAEPEGLVFCDKHSIPHPRTDECVNPWPVKPAPRRGGTDAA